MTLAAELKKRMAIDLRVFGLAGYGCDAVYGLSKDEAMRSMRRQATEPIIWEDTQQRLEKFVEQLHEAGVVLVGESVSAFNVGEYE